jgi:hypothetical protein
MKQADLAIVASPGTAWFEALVLIANSGFRLKCRLGIGDFQQGENKVGASTRRNPYHHPHVVAKELPERWDDAIATSS